MPTGGIRTRTSGIMIPAFVAPATVAFTPASLTNLIFWYKMDKDAYQDLTGTTPCTDGTELQLWKNQASTGSTYDLLGGNATWGVPGLTYRAANLNGLPTAENNGGNSLGTSGTPIALGGQVCSVFMVVKYTNGGTDRLISVANAADTAADAFLIYPASTLTTPTTFNNGNVGSQTVVANSWNNLGTIFDGANNTMYVAGSTTGGTPAAASPTFNAAVGLGVTMKVGSGNFQTGFVAEVVGTKSVMSAGEIANLKTYFLGRWGV